MATYVVSGYATIGIVAEIEAESEAEARKTAAELDLPGLCHQCSGAGGDDCWTLNEFDDLPDDCIQNVAKYD